MHSPSADAVRLLAAWQQQRRALTDRLDGLLLHGPTAVDRVAGRAEELRAAMDAERAAFECFVRGVQDPPAVPLLAPLPAPAPPSDVLEVSYPPLRSVRTEA